MASAAAGGSGTATNASEAGDGPDSIALRNHDSDYLQYGLRRVTAAGRPADPARWGVRTEYVDAVGVRRRSEPRAVGAVLASMGAGAGPPPQAFRPPARRVAEPCHQPAPGWGWAVQLYALRSRDSWGIGDLGDLRALGRWARGLGAAMLLLNPLHAALPGTPREPSPYFPSSRAFRDPLYLRVEDVPGAADEPLVARLGQRGRALNAAPSIDRDAVAALKARALEALWDRFTGDERFTAYCADESELLERYACFCALAERYGDHWTSWPAQFRSPLAVSLARLPAALRPRVEYHRWLQWLVDVQLQRASAEMPLVHDIAVGVAPDGADAWMWQELVARAMRIGAPPDRFNPRGQDWALAPFDPHRLREAGCAPVRETLRRVMRGAAGVRIDHVMGLFRLWWVPDGERPDRGAYVDYPAADLLEVVAAESRRSACYVVGEDLGTVEAGVRPALRHRGVLSYRLAWFEQRPPQRYPREALAALSTHDLPTVAGAWTGSDAMEATQERDGAGGESETARRRLRRLTGLPRNASPAAVAESAYAALARAPSVLIAATLDDAALAERRPNLPGASEARHNWCIPLPRTVEQLRRDAVPRAIAAHLEGHR